jgi:hypothetical protein
MSSVLIKAISNTDTTLTVSEDNTSNPYIEEGTFAAAGGTIQIDLEQITYSSHYMGQFQIAVRGANGTAAVAHLIGAVVVPVSPNLGSVNVIFMNAAGAPTNGTTGQYFAQTGSMYSDVTGGNVYIQTGTLASPVWKLVTRAS